MTKVAKRDRSSKSRKARRGKRKSKSKTKKGLEKKKSGKKGGISCCRSKRGMKKAEARRGKKRTKSKRSRKSRRSKRGRKSRKSKSRSKSKKSTSKTSSGEILANREHLGRSQSLTQVTDQKKSSAGTTDSANQSITPYSPMKEARQTDKEKRRWCNSEDRPPSEGHQCTSSC
ncbi:hypothetical protein Q1695_006117 [Nippostrongylus brasiliensis]|nr:hypothetical protein Q1695_006117 [Nippostrongylus brasiliensis]